MANLCTSSLAPPDFRRFRPVLIPPPPSYVVSALTADVRELVRPIRQQLQPVSMTHRRGLNPNGPLRFAVCPLTVWTVWCLLEAIRGSCHIVRVLRSKRVSVPDRVHLLSGFGGYESVTPHIDYVHRLLRAGRDSNLKVKHRFYTETDEQQQMSGSIILNSVTTYSSNSCKTCSISARVRVESTLRRGLPLPLPFDVDCSLAKRVDRSSTAIRIECNGSSKPPPPVVVSPALIRPYDFSITKRTSDREVTQRKSKEFETIRYTQTMQYKNRNTQLRQYKSQRSGLVDLFLGRSAGITTSRCRCTLFVSAEFVIKLIRIHKRSVLSSYRVGYTTGLFVLW